LIAAYLVILVGAAIYWLDDVFGLAPTLRLVLQFLSGAAVCYVLLGKMGIVELMLACGAAGILNVCLTNTVNFTDGADLNLATAMILTFATVLLVGADAMFMRSGVSIMLAFVAAFALFNFRPRSLYFGDAGCFVFATFMTAMAVRYLNGGTANSAAYAALPMALPVCDALYVVRLRIRAGDTDLRSRNFLHLYQKLQARGPGFGYLLPQFGSLAVVATLAAVLQTAGLPVLWAVIAAGALGAPVFYALVRHYYVR
jgi:UDP-N-acetylmuramyl pentapeptide phosphotransferase/UDP-N-acetylglucosamine-1-phosphate transferase